jgi:hypothetical protein
MGASSDRQGLWFDFAHHPEPVEGPPTPRLCVSILQVSSLGTGLHVDLMCQGDVCSNFATLSRIEKSNGRLASPI